MIITVSMIFRVLIFAVNLIYIPCIWHGLVGDDAINFKLSAFPHRLWKLENILMHMLSAQLIFLAFGSSHIAFTLAMFFSVHPLCVQVPAWVAGRGYGVNALILLLVIAFAPFSAFLYLFYNASNANLLFSPFLFLFTKHWYVVLIFPIVAYLTYKPLKSNINTKIKGDGVMITPLPKDFFLHKFKFINLIIVVKTFGYYALMGLLPMKNGFYNSFLVDLGISVKGTRKSYSLNRHFWGGLFAIIYMSILWWFNKTNYIGMGIFIFVSSLIPFLNFITVQQHVAPRYAYVAMIGFHLALSSLIWQSPYPDLYKGLVLGALFIFYFDRTIKVLQHYSKDTTNLITLDGQVFPDSPRIWYYKYEQMLHKNNPLMAWAEAAYGLRYLPEDCQLWFGLACASFELGDLNAAKMYVDNSEKFMMLADRECMRSVINELKYRINTELEKKWRA